MQGAFFDYLSGEGEDDLTSESTRKNLKDMEKIAIFVTITHE